MDQQEHGYTGSSKQARDDIALSCGTFTIIVLGEVIVGVVSGVAEQPHLDWLASGTAFFGMLIAIGLRWIFFDFVSGRPPIRRTTNRLGWIYLHIPVSMGITAVGASTLNVVEHAGATLRGEIRWLLVTSIACVLISTALITKSLDLPENQRSLFWMSSRAMFITGVLIVLLGVSPIGTILLLVILIVLLLAPVF